jgi:hypothetical protein
MKIKGAQVFVADFFFTQSKPVWIENYIIYSLSLIIFIVV